MIGKTIGKYRIVGQLGRGGMGIVYRAVDELLDREVAIKVLNAELAGTEMMERFRTEAITLAKLNHAEIATIYEHRDMNLASARCVFVAAPTRTRDSSHFGPSRPVQLP